MHTVSHKEYFTLFKLNYTATATMHSPKPMCTHTADYTHTNNNVGNACVEIDESRVGM